MYTKQPHSPTTASQREILWDVLDTLNLGLGIFDSDLKLMKWNREFQELRSYPDNLCRTGVDLEAFLDHDFKNGQLSFEGSDEPVQSWMRRARLRNRYAIEHAANDGRVISMMLTPSGTDRVLLIFSDVTEQSRINQALSANQEWYDLVSEASSEGVYDWNIKTNDLKASYRLTAMLGMSPGDLTADDWNKRIHPEDFQSYRDALVGHFKGETPVLKIEYRVQRKSGDYIWFSDSGKCIRGEDGRAARLVGSVADVTTQKLAETSLQKSEERYALAMQAINEGVYDWDIESDEIYYSTGVRSALGLDPSQLRTADDWVARIHSDDRIKWRNALIDHFKGRKERFECEFRFRGGDGQWRWARQQGIAQFDGSGRATRMIGASGDITELMDQRAAASEARNQLTKAIDTISDGFAIYDSEDRLVLCNKQYQALYPGLDDTLIPGARYEDILRTLADRMVLAEIGDDIELWVRERLKQRRKATGSYHAQLTDGRWANVSWRRTQDGGLVGVFTDITQLKTAEIRLRESEERYALAMQSANEGLWDWDVVGGGLYMAPRWLHELGLSPDSNGKISEANWQARVAPEDLPVFLDSVRAHFTGKTDFYSCEFRVLNARDEYVWLYHRGVGQRDENGKVYRLIGSATDVTAKKLPKPVFSRVRNATRWRRRRPPKVSMIGMSQPTNWSYRRASTRSYLFQRVA